MQFEYWTQRARGARYEKRILTAASKASAEKELLDRQIPVLEIRAVGERKARGLGRVPLTQKIIFAQQMEIAQGISMGMKESIELAIEMTEHPRFKRILESVRNDVSSGRNLHDAMQRTGAFDSLTLGLVRAGEQSGALAKAFGQIKDIMTRNLQVRKKLIGLMIYPAIIVVVMMLVTFVLMYKTVPVFIGLFRTAGVDLPLPTMILMRISDFFVGYPWLVAIIMGIILLVMVKIPSIYRHAHFSHGLILRLPLIGEIQRKLINETFTRTLVNLMESGMSMLDSVALCRAVSSCFEYKAAIARAHITIARGGYLMQSLIQDRDIFGVLIVRAIGFGEKTGKTEEMLKPLSAALTQDISSYIEHMKTIIEPVFTLVCGVFVLLILLAMFIPIFSLPKLI